MNDATRAFAQKSQLELRVVDQAGESTPAIISILNKRKRPIFPKKAQRFGDFYCTGGESIVEFFPGDYTYELHHGLEYKKVQGGFSAKQGDDDNKQITLSRIRDLKEEGWYSGDLCVFADPSDGPMIGTAADLWFTNFVASNREQFGWRKKIEPKSHRTLESGRLIFQTSTLDLQKDFGGVICLTKKPIDLTTEESKTQSAFHTLQIARKSESFNIALDASSKDLPLWIANDLVDAISVLGPNVSLKSVKTSTGSRTHPNVKSVSSDQSDFMESERVYFNLLNAGFRISPTANSAAGIGKNYPGFNRVYVYSEEKPTAENWLANHKTGNVVVTNGPLLRVRANDEVPGKIFRDPRLVSLTVTASLAIRSKTEALQIIKNGRVIHRILLKDWAKAQGKLPTIEFQESGWLAVRVESSSRNTRQVALTAPFYVEIKNKQRISKTAAQFFVDWVVERGKTLKKSKHPAAKSTFTAYRDAYTFWKDRLKNANAE